jgi:hypothetical protein
VSVDLFCAPLFVVLCRLWYFFGEPKLVDVLIRLIELVKSSYCTIWPLGHLLIGLLFNIYPWVFVPPRQWTSSIYTKQFLYAGIPWRDSLYDSMVWTANHLWCPCPTESRWEYFWEPGSPDGKCTHHFVRFRQPTILHDLEPVFSSIVNVKYAHHF